MAIELGVQARDKITGFTGIITGKASYLTGCDQYVLVPKMTEEDKKVRDSVWFDEGRLEVVGPGINAEEVQGEKNGGPQRDAPKL